MRIAKGRVAEGRVIVEGEALAEGAEVTVLCTDEPSFELSEADVAELLEAIDEADRGKALDADEVLARLRR